MKKITLETITWSNAIIVAAFLLVAIVAGTKPISPAAGRQLKSHTAEKGKAIQTPTLSGDYCSLAAFHQLVNNIKDLRQGISTRKAAELTKYIWLAGARFDCDPKLIAALIQVESSFFSQAKSEKGALGLMQLRPFVARELARRLETTWGGVKTLHDPKANILMGTYYLVSLIHDFSDLSTALVAYNCGPTYVRRRLRRGMRLPTTYPAKILTLYQNFAANQS